MRKARFPRETIPASTVTVQLVTFAAILALLAPLAVALRGTFGLAAAAAAGRGRAAVLLRARLRADRAALHAYFRDVAPILTAALLPWFFLTPIFFEPDSRLRSCSHRSWARCCRGSIRLRRSSRRCARSCTTGRAARLGTTHLRGRRRGAGAAGRHARCSAGWRASWRWWYEPCSRLRCARARSCCATRRARSASAPIRPARSRAAARRGGAGPRARCRRCRA